MKNYVLRAGLAKGPENEIVGKLEGPGKLNVEYEIEFKKLVMVEYLWIQKMTSDDFMIINGLSLTQGKIISKLVR